MRIEATPLRQLSPPLRYFVLSETLHCAIIKFGNVIVSRLSLKFAFTLHCTIIKFGNVIVSRLKFAFTDQLAHALTYGHSKESNLFLVGPTNCAKSFLLMPVQLIYDCFMSPSNSKFNFVTAIDRGGIL